MREATPDGEKYAELRRSTKQQQERIAEQRAEIDHGANGNEDQQREYLGLIPA